MNLSDFASTTASRTKELLEVYNSLPEPTIADTPEVMHSRLLSVRALMSSLSGLVADLVILQAAAKNKMSMTKESLDIAESDALQKKHINSTDFLSGQERRANLRAQNLDLEAAYRKSQRQYEDIAATLEYVRVYHREFDRAVRDVELRIRLLSFGIV